MPETSTPPAGTPNRNATKERTSAYVIGWIAKAVAVYLGIAEHLGEARAGILILAGVFFLGAQAVESVALRLIDKFFAKDSP
jgi:hypothetical protein